MTAEAAERVTGHGDPHVAHTPATEDPTDDPTPPGSPQARKLGCGCPSFLNGDGSGLRTGPGQLDDGAYLTHPDCKLHGGI